MVRRENLALVAKWRILHCAFIFHWNSKKIAEFFAISVSTVNRIKLEFRRTHTLANARRYSRPRMLGPADLSYIKHLVRQYPDYFLDEYCQCFYRDNLKRVSPTTMWRAIKVLRRI